ncbi:MAG: helix-turn-helix domain-containing protein [Oscillibacter sp.]|nr:helix-turn-helix domain-containing protein [Oscillibacter sp.]
MKLFFHSSLVARAAIADALAIRPEYLSRLFHRETGVTFQEYVNRVRAERAAQWPGVGVAAGTRRNAVSARNPPAGKRFRVSVQRPSPRGAVVLNASFYG